MNIHVLSADGSFVPFNYEYEGHHDVQTLTILFTLKYGQIIKIREVRNDLGDTLLLIVDEEVFDVDWLQSFLRQWDNLLSQWEEDSEGCKVRRYAHRVAEPVGDAIWCITQSDGFEGKFEEWNYHLDVIADHRVTYEIVNRIGHRFYIYYVNTTVQMCSEIAISHY